ncbi:MAG: hypothetical protein WC322_06590 [Candidatus Paceibacterota bacterium]|jgi:hypothetical protein
MKIPKPTSTNVNRGEHAPVIGERVLIWKDPEAVTPTREGVAVVCSVGETGTVTRRFQGEYTFNGTKVMCAFEDPYDRCVPENAPVVGRIFVWE